MEQHLIEVVEQLGSEMVIIENHTKTKADFMNVIEKYYDTIKMGFEHKEFRTCPVHFRLFDNEDATIHTLELRHFITNLMFWLPMVELNLYDRVDDSYIIDAKAVTTKSIKDYFDKKIVIPFRREINNQEKLNKVASNMIFQLSRISTDFNIILGMTINVETFIDLANKNQRFNEIIRTKLDDSMQPNEIESTLESLMNEEIDILRNEDNLLQPMLRARAGIKDKQLSEFSINGGLKPDNDGKTIPIPINSNFIVGGLSSITNYYIDTVGGRKSAIMNKTVMGRSGHFARMVMLLSSGVRLSREVKDCGTVHPAEVELKTYEHMYRYKGRYYRLPHHRTYRVLNGDEEYLIGKKIFVRTPVTCASEEICEKCYGELYFTNASLESVGGYAASKITEPLSQSVLSAKHLLTTNSEKIGFNPEFNELFSINANEVTLNIQNEIEFKDYSLIIIADNMRLIEEFADDDQTFNSYIEESFHVLNKKTGEIIEMTEMNGKAMFISPELRKLLRSTKTMFDDREVYEISLAAIGDDDRIFVVEISNNELTKPLWDIIKLLNKKDHNGYSTINEIIQVFIDLLIISKIESDAIHAEAIVRALVRRKSNVLKRPNFREYIAMEDYEILTVESALKRHPSVLIGLSFQDLGRQLSNPLTFKKRGTSFIDPFFRERP